MRAILALALMLAVAPALGQQQQQQQQQQQDPAFLQRALGALQAQRNAALDGQAAAEARVGMLTEEVARLTAELKQQKQNTGAAPAKE
jgi:uncharacterized small protein (DUF1192 family)